MNLEIRVTTGLSINEQIYKGNSLEFLSNCHLQRGRTRTNEREREGEGEKKKTSRWERKKGKREGRQEKYDRSEKESIARNIHDSMSRGTTIRTLIEGSRREYARSIRSFEIALNRKHGYVLFETPPTTTPRKERQCSPGLALLVEFLTP